MVRALLIATTNPGKVHEIRALLAGLPAELRDLTSYPTLPEPAEDGSTFEANARIKALYYARHSGLLTLADDSGLEVACLGGAPGVHSARFAGLPRDDAANNAKLVGLLKDVPFEQRTACFRCCAAVADAGAVLAVAEGRVDGLILDAPRGSHGFGYDPHFHIPELNRTTAELEPELKNRISHRGRALAALAPRLRELLSHY